MNRLACVNFNSDMSWGYIEGYRKAGELLALRMLEGYDLDYLVYPMGYMYRHHLELQLKHLISKCGELLDETDDPRKIHLLKDLWMRLRTKLKLIQADADDFLAEIDDKIDFVDSLDRTGQEFRYSKTTARSPSLQAARHVDIEKLYSAYEMLSKNLQAVHDFVSADLSIKNEFFCIVAAQQAQAESETRELYNVFAD